LSAVVFHLKRFWEGRAGSAYIKGLDLYEEIKQGRKTSEWRNTTDYWLNRLFFKKPPPRRAWFVVGYPRGNLPRLEADIIGILLHVGEDQIEVKIANVEEIPKEDDK